MQTRGEVLLSIFEVRRESIMFFRCARCIGWYGHVDFDNTDDRFIAKAN